MKLSLDIRTSLSQTLTPQQIQYLKLLQLPVIQLEQQVIQELELNPMLEEFNYESDPYSTDGEQSDLDYLTDSPSHEIIEPTTDYSGDDYDSEYISKPQIDDKGDPFEFYKLIWQEEPDYSHKSRLQAVDEDESEPFQIKDNLSFVDELMQQLRMLDLTEEDFLLGEQIIGNVDTDGYLRRELQEIIDETNAIIVERNFEVRTKAEKEAAGTPTLKINPARQFALNGSGNGNNNEKTSDDKIENYQDISVYNTLKPIIKLQAEHVLLLVQGLEPPGIASRNIQECLIAQCQALPKHNAAQRLALEILQNAYEPFAMKHFNAIIKQFEVTEDYLKEALDVIKRLNPKPGGGVGSGEIHTVIPDFIIEKDEDTGELLITVNDSRLPTLKLSNAYEKLKKEAKFKLFNKETREWIRNKYEDAKFLIQAIRQRRNTMLKVMTAIAGLQQDFFEFGPPALKPLIYKDVSEQTGLDISTVCRIVNGKYVQTEFGTYELKFFFSESLPNEEGEEVSTTVIKQIIREIIEGEPKDKPYSDDKISDELKKKSFIVARRTVAKYREQMRLPVARLRKEL